MVETVFELVMNSVETLIIMDFVTRYLGFKYQDSLKYVGFGAAWFAAFTELNVVNRLVVFEGIGLLIPVAIYFVYALIFLKGKLWQKLWASALIQLVVCAIADIISLFLCGIWKYDVNDLFSVFNVERVIAVIIAKILLFYVSRVILKLCYRNPLDKRTWFLLILMPLTSLISLCALIPVALHSKALTGYILFGIVGIVISNIITYYFFIEINKDYETKLALKLQKQNTAAAKKSIEDSNAFVEQMKSVRHDIKNQLAIISGYINEGKYEEAKRYVTELTDDFLPDIRTFANTDNDAFTAIINSKAAVCSQKNIYIKVNEMEGALKGFNGIDIGILFGNLLDNAIEAAEKTDERRISVDVYRKGTYLNILIKNSIKSSVLKTNSGLSTSKKNKSEHGIGIKSIKAVAEKYEGTVEFYEQDDEFCSHVMLYIPKFRSQSV